MAIIHVIIFVLGTYVSKHEERMEISIGMTESHVNDNQSLIQLTNDSGIGLSIVSNNDSELTQHVEEESKQDEESEEVSENVTT